MFSGSIRASVSNPAKNVFSGIGMFCRVATRKTSVTFLVEQVQYVDAT